MIPLVQKPKTPGTNSLFFLNHDGQVLGDNSNLQLNVPAQRFNHLRWISSKTSKNHLQLLIFKTQVCGPGTNIECGTTSHVQSRCKPVELTLYLKIDCKLLINSDLWFLFNSKCKEGTEKCNLWNIQDVLIFIAMGFVGGLLGAWFNALNKHLTVHRILHVYSRAKHVR